MGENESHTQSAAELEKPNLTAQRRLVLELLKEADGAMDAKELYRRAIARDRSISSATVYRSLNLFKQLGLIDERRFTKSRCSYEIKQPADHTHLVCRCCGNIIEFDSPLVGKLVASVRQQRHFNVMKVDLYLEGYCAECDGKQPASRGDKTTAVANVGKQ